jgi:hypothetical protein
MAFLKMLPAARVFCLIVPLAAAAQFSPGELSIAHERLDGIKNCTYCHQVGRKIDGSKCLACHSDLKARIEANRGFHVSSEVRGKKCFVCHFEHKGRNNTPVQWPTEPKNFDHKLAGYALEGKHDSLQCEACHQQKYVRDSLVLRRIKNGSAARSTYLGLDRQCLSCHFDEHRGQLGNDRCGKCHDFLDWKKSAARKFNHDSTSYPLTGKHVTAPCVRCHALRPDANTMRSRDSAASNKYYVYKGVESKYCTACHKDVHENRLGRDCSVCHTPQAWVTSSALQKTDHDKTRYPLLGKHTTVACDRCHCPATGKPAAYRNLAFRNCRDCHADAHAGQFAGRKDKGSCEACHDVNGFVPSHFTAARHNQESAYALSGAHFVAKCDSCHGKVKPDSFHKRTGLSAPHDSALTLFIIHDTACAGCHADYHEGQFLRHSKGASSLSVNACDECHTTAAFKFVHFDHQSQSRFKLSGAHKLVKCEACHVQVVCRSKAVKTLYRPISSECASCHRNPHQGAFDIR